MKEKRLDPDRQQQIEAILKEDLKQSSIGVIKELFEDYEELKEEHGESLETITELELSVKNLEKKVSDLQAKEEEAKKLKADQRKLKTDQNKLEKDKLDHEVTKGIDQFKVDSANEKVELVKDMFETVFANRTTREVVNGQVIIKEQHVQQGNQYDNTTGKYDEYVTESDRQAPDDKTKETKET